jgi:uncharacterized protein
VLYLDASALIKLYVREPGSDRVRREMESEEAGGRPIFTSVLTFVEVHAAFVQKVRDRSLTNRQFHTCCQRFDTDWIGLTPVPLDASVLLIVRDVVNLGLKGADAVQLASAMWLKNSLIAGAFPGATTTNVTFGTSDKRLIKAATIKKLGVFDPQTP